MEKSVIILGAKGRFGRTALETFNNKGWRVSAFARHWEQNEKTSNTRYLSGNAFDLKLLTRACMDHDVILNALNPKYEDWEEMLPTITRNIISAGIASGATVMIPGNVYNYGNELPPVISEETPHVSNTKKGRLRIKMEQAYKDACADGLRTIVLRGGDFFEGKDTGNWFETYITNKIDRGIVTYPGPLNSIHSWAYLPDVTRAMVELAERRHLMNGFEEFGFKGYSVTGAELVKALEKACRRELRAKKFPWLLVRGMALFSRQIHEILEMRYLWQRPHEIDGKKLKDILPDFQATPFQSAVNTVVGNQPLFDMNATGDRSLEPVKT